MTEEMHRRKNLSRMYTIQLVSEDSVYDTEETFYSNQQILLTCCEYIVMDLRNDNDRARVPTDMAFQEMYDTFMDELGEDIKEYMEKGKVKALKDLLNIMAPNKYTPVIKNWLKTRGRPNVGHKRIKIQIG